MTLLYSWEMRQNLVVHPKDVGQARKLVNWLQMHIVSDVEMHFFSGSGLSARLSLLPFLALPPHFAIRELNLSCGGPKFCHCKRPPPLSLFLQLRRQRHSWRHLCVYFQRQTQKALTNSDRWHISPLAKAISKYCQLTKNGSRLDLRALR